MFNKLGKLVNYIQRQANFGSRREKEMAEQKDFGYEAKYVQYGGEHYVIYQEDGKSLDVCVEFDWENNVTVFTKSFDSWLTPKREKLAELDYQKVLNRVVKYLSLWGEVRLDDSPPVGTEELKASLKKDGIEFQEVDGVVIYESTVEKEKERKTSVFKN